jgi:hypothetical protein
VSKIGIGFLLMLVFTLVFGIFLDGFATVLNWTSGGSSLADFTGLEQFIKFSPFIAWILGFGTGIVLAALGLRELASGKGKGGSSSGGMH